MATTQELANQLRDYAQYRYTRACTDILGLSDEQLTEAIGTATTWERAWRNTRAYCKTGSTAPPPKVAKLSTAEYRSRMRPLDGFRRFEGERLVCWEACVEAFGVRARSGKAEHVTPILSHLKAAGYGLEEVVSLAPAGVTPTLAVFLAARPRGDYMVFMNHHVIAVRDGVVTDTTGSGQTVKRCVTSAYRVIKPEVPAGRCTCDTIDPIVFGHARRCPLAGFVLPELNAADLELAAQS